MPAASHVEKDGRVHQHPADGAVARQGARPARRRALRAVVHAPPDQARQRALRALDRRPGLADRQPHLGLRRARARTPSPRAEDVLREINGYDVATGEPVPGFAELKADGTTACGCWIYSRHLRRRRQPGAPPRPRRRRRPRGRLGLARVGLGVAGEPPHPLQPRLRRPAGQAVVGAQEVRLVGRGRGQVDGLRRPGLPRRQAARTTARPTTPSAWTRSPATTRSS